VLPVIILFAKAPVSGQVKTRLAARIGPDAAAELHTALVLDTFANLRTLSTAVDVEIHSDVPTAAWPVAQLQSTGDMGNRLFHALSLALVQGRPHVSVVSSDAPTVPLSHLKSLLQSRSDVAVGPTESGGSYAVSCRRTHPEMFHGVPWSTGSTAAAAVKGAQACGLSAERGPEWFGVEEYPQLQRVLSSPALPQNLARWKSRYSRWLR
jgi:uncharacterized protein